MIMMAPGTTLCELGVSITELCSNALILDIIGAGGAGDAGGSEA
jgi:hypothetical protein